MAETEREEPATPSPVSPGPPAHAFQTSTANRILPAAFSPRATPDMHSVCTYDARELSIPDKGTHANLHVGLTGLWGDTDSLSPREGIILEY